MGSPITLILTPIDSPHLQVVFRLTQLIIRDLRNSFFFFLFLCLYPSSGDYSFLILLFLTFISRFFLFFFFLACFHIYLQSSLGSCLLLYFFHYSSRSLISEVCYFLFSFFFPPFAFLDLFNIFTHPKVLNKAPEKEKKIDIDWKRNRILSPGLWKKKRRK